MTNQPDARPVRGARAAALRALAVVDNPEGPGLDEAVDEAAEHLNLDSRDRGLAREIAFGVTRWRYALDEALRPFLERPPAGREAWVRDVLRLGAYQLLYLDRIPAHAAVKESVNLVAASRDGLRLVGLCNAVLRRVAEVAEQPDRTPPPAETQFPSWIRESLSRTIGPEAMRAMLRASNAPAPLVLRVRPGAEPVANALSQRDDVIVRRGRLAPEARVIDARGIAPTSLEGFNEGLLTVEDEGAQVAAHLASAGAKGPVLDLCAAPGGKVSHIADMVWFRGDRIVAADISDARRDLLENTLGRLGLSKRIEVASSERILAAEADGSFGFVLVDAPCSGFGTLRRHPEIRWRRKPEDLERLGKLQIDILQRAARLVARGGLLAFVTCTTTREEGEDVLAKVMARGGFTLEDAAPEDLPFDASTLRLSRGLYRTLPGREDCDGFTIARLRKAS